MSKKRILYMLLVLVMMFTLIPVLPVSGAEAPLLTAVGDPVQFHEKSFKESVGVFFEEEFNMIFIEGGEFTLGWEAGTVSPGTLNGGVPDDVKPLPGVVVSDYYLSDTLVTNRLWNAVMGLQPPSQSTANTPKSNADYYEVHEFLTRLYVLTGRTYYMPTEAQYEYAAKGGKPGYALGHNLLPFPGSRTQAAVYSGSGTGGAVKRFAPNILGIYDFLSNHGEWVWNDWHNVHIGGTDPTGLRGPIHAQKTRRGGQSATGVSEYHSRLIRSIDGTGPTLRIALSADQISVPPGMTLPKDIHAPRVNDLNTPNSHRDMRWVSPEGYVWEGQFRGYAGGAMKVWATGEVVLRPHNFNGQDAGDIIGQWYTFNNYGMVIIPNADSPNANKDRILIPYMFIGTEEGHKSVSTINDRRTAFTSGPNVKFPDVLMFPTGRLDLIPESDTIEFYANNTVHSPDTAENWGLTYENYPWFGGSYAAIEKPVVPNLVALEDLKAGEGIVAADHYLVDFGSFTGRQGEVFPMDVRSQDPRLIDGPDRGWWMGYGFGGIHTYRKDVDAGANFRFSVYTALEGQNANTNGSLARGPWFTVNNMFKRTQINAAGTAFHDELYLIIPNSNGEVTTSDVHFNLRDMTYMDYERGDNRRFLLRNNEDILRHTNEASGQTTAPGGTGNTTWRMPHGDPRRCPGVPNPVGTQLLCGGDMLHCYCPVFCLVCGNQICTCNDPVLTIGGTAKLHTNDANTALTYTVSAAKMPAGVGTISFTLSIEDAFFSEIALRGIEGWGILEQSGWTVNGGFLQKDITMTKSGGASDNFNVLEIVLNYKGETGKTAIELINATAATPGKKFNFNVSFEITVDTYSKYDVNKDGIVDESDLASAVIYFMYNSTDENWKTLTQYESDNDVGYVEISAERSDVNGDGVVNISDLILILRNYS